jgi:alkanesulfonate monooxygenase SsuD/methylene tetrahydromethanopterin reductase-like flavin-dependent oxidoreductase (luciferase family)
MTTVGAVCLPQVEPERLRDVVRAGEEAGLAEVWLWEDCFWGGGVATATAVLGWTERVRVGVGVFPVPLRNVALAAMELAALSRLFPGRMRIGVGHGVQDWMGQVGARVESPMTLLKEYVQALRGLLDGERLTSQGRYVRLAGVKLDRPPRTAPPILAGASGPKTMRLTGEVADGTILTDLTTPEDITQTRRLVAEGRQAAGRQADHEMVVYLLTATGADARERLDREQQRLNHPKPGAGVAGDAQEIAKAVHRWAGAGAGTVVLQPTIDEPDPAGFLRFVGEEVTPLVR